MIILSLCFGGMYVHDRVIMSSLVNERLAGWIALEKEEKEKNWENLVKKELEKKLFIVKVGKVQASKQLLWRKVKVSYSLPAFAFMDAKTKMTFEAVREDISPVNYMWDAKK